jgi:hypothetical protein
MGAIYDNCKDAWAFANWEAITEARSGTRYITVEDMIEVYWMTFMGGLIPEDENSWTEQRRC